MMAEFDEIRIPKGLGMLSEGQNIKFSALRALLNCCRHNILYVCFPTSSTRALHMTASVHEAIGKLELTQGSIQGV